MRLADRKRVLLDGIRSGALTAVARSRQQEQPGKFLRAAQSFFSLFPIVSPVTNLTDNQPFVIRNGVQRRHSGIGKAVHEDQFAACDLNSSRSAVFALFFAASASSNVSMSRSKSKLSQS